MRSRSDCTAFDATPATRTGAGTGARSIGAAPATLDAAASLATATIGAAAEGIEAADAERTGARTIRGASSCRWAPPWFDASAPLEPRRVFEATRDVAAALRGALRMAVRWLRAACDARRPRALSLRDASPPLATPRD